MTELTGEYQLVHKRLMASQRTWLAAIMFALGAAAGSFAAFSIPPSCAWTPRMVSSAVFGVGEHLCRTHEGIANITRVDEDVYAFTCRELAEFPRVPITLAPVGRTTP